MDVFRQEDRIVNQFLVTLVTKRGGRALSVPRTFGTDRVAGRAASVGRATEKAFRNVMMPSCV